MSNDLSPDDVLRNMLNTPPKPHDKPPESSGPRRRGRPIGGNGTGSGSTRKSH